MIGTLGSITSYEKIEFSEYRFVVNQHQPSGAQFTSFQLTYPDGYHGNITLTKGQKNPRWNPKKDIKRIIVEFNED